VLFPVKEMGFFKIFHKKKEKAKGNEKRNS
jgi:hypothetical protein